MKLLQHPRAVLLALNLLCINTIIHTSAEITTEQAESKGEQCPPALVIFRDTYANYKNALRHYAYVDTLYATWKKHLRDLPKDMFVKEETDEPMYVIATTARCLHLKAKRDACAKNVQHAKIALEKLTRTYHHNNISIGNGD